MAVTIRDQRYLIQRGRGWAFQIAIPKALRGRFRSGTGRPLAMITLGLGTDSLSEARKRRDAKLAEWRTKFERAALAEPLTPAEIDAEAREVYTSTLERLEADAKRGLLPAVAADQAVAISVAIDHMHEAIAPQDMDNWDQPEIDLDQHIEMLTDFEFAANEIAGVERRKSVAGMLSPESTTYRLLGRAVTRAILDALNGRLRLLRGQPSEMPATFLGAKGIDPVSLTPISKATKRPKVIIRSDGGLRFSEAAALWLAEVGDTRRRQTVEARQAVHQLFIKHTGDASLTAITRADAADFLATMKDERKLSAKTLNQYAASISAVFKWARKRGKLDSENPFAGQTYEEPKSAGWSPYTADELSTLLIVPPDENILAWAMLIALYSGMRLNEICGLQVGDVRREHDIDFFDVHEHAGRKLKTDAAARRIPVHSKLIEAGLLDYARSLPNDALFPSLTPGGPDAKPGKYLGEKFTRYRREVGVNRERVSFHSFRKNFATALDQAGVAQADAAMLLGHARGFSFDVYSGGPGLKRLRDVVECVRNMI